MEAGDPRGSAELLPLVYDELRRLARARMAAERVDHTLQATALVHEAYLRLVNGSQAQSWNSRGHFFAAAAEAMRRILVESARRKASAKRGGGHDRVSLGDDLAATCGGDGDELLEFNDLLDLLAADDAQAAELVKLRLFAGLSVEEAGVMLGMSRTVAYDNWKYARAWFTCYKPGKGPGIASA